MSTTLTIDTFYAQLTSEEKNPLLDALRSLTQIEKDDLLKLFTKDIPTWGGWGF